MDLYDKLLYGGVWCDSPKNPDILLSAEILMGEMPDTEGEIRVYFYSFMAVNDGIALVQKNDFESSDALMEYMDEWQPDRRRWKKSK